MLTRIVAAALAAAVVGGLASAFLQEIYTTPLILTAETFETAAPGHSHADHDHAHAPSAPAGDWERTAYTTLATVGTMFGYGLVLLAIMMLSNARITARTGLAWGVAGFAAAGLAPALGLGPELPGAAAADLTARQLWWAGTAFATAAGLFLTLRVSTWLAVIGGGVLIALPHLVGAPHPPEFASQVPAELSAQFAAASLVVNAVGWALLGAVAGLVWARMSAGRD